MVIEIHFYICLVCVGGQTYTRETSWPILRYDVPPPQHSSPPEDSPVPPTSTGTNMVTWLILSAPHSWIRMETDRIHMETDSDISDIRFPIFFQFLSPMMETDQIHMETDSYISHIHFPVYLPFPSLSMSDNMMTWLLKSTSIFLTCMQVVKLTQVNCHFQYCTAKSNCLRRQSLADP